MAEKTVDYLRCPNCSYVYEVTQDKCPQCGKDTVINESELDQEVFNLKESDITNIFFLKTIF